MNSNERQPNLVAWQWNLYSGNHVSRANLVMHVLTVPLFWAGTLSLIGAFLISPWLAFGAILMPLAVGLQGRTHKAEAVAPVPFAGPKDVVGRIFVEQWFTWPRFVLTGGFFKAWKASATGWKPAAN